MLIHESMSWLPTLSIFLVGMIIWGSILVGLYAFA